MPKKKPKPKAKTEFLQIRVTPEQKYRIAKAATAEYLDPSTWARVAILKAAEEAERYRNGASSRKGAPSEEEERGS